MGVVSSISKVKVYQSTVPITLPKTNIGSSSNK